VAAACRHRSARAPGGHGRYGDASAARGLATAWKAPARISPRGGSDLPRWGRHPEHAAIAARESAAGSSRTRRAALAVPCDRRHAVLPQASRSGRRTAGSLLPTPNDCQGNSETAYGGLTHRTCRHRQVGRVPPNGLPASTGPPLDRSPRHPALGKRLSVRGSWRRTRGTRDPARRPVPPVHFRKHPPSPLVSYPRRPRGVGILLRVPPFKPIQ
jgi:hypothetical protein